METRDRKGESQREVPGRLLFERRKKKKGQVQHHNQFSLDHKDGELKKGHHQGKRGY